MSDHRQVRRLHLRGARQADLRRATPLVEDALRVASIPLGPPGSLIVIRRLDLGAIRLDQPSQVLALRITERVRALTSRAVHVLRPGAPAASVVWFQGRWEAQALLVMRLLRGPPPQEWFWRSAVSQWSPALPPARLVEALVRPEPFARPGEPPPALAVAVFLEALARWGGLVEALSLLPQAPALPWALPDAPPAQQRLPAHWERALSLLVARHGLSWPGLPWLLAQAVTAARPEVVGSSRLLDVVAAHRARLELADAVVVGRERPAAPPETPADRPPPTSPREEEGSTVSRRLGVEIDAATDAAPRATAPARRRPPAASSPPPASEEVAARSSLASPSTEEPAPERAPRRTQRVEPAPPPERQPMASTGYGGVVTALWLLERLGFGERVQRAPALAACAFGWRVLSATLDRLRGDPEEPLRAALRPRAEPVPLLAPPFEPPARWRALLEGDAPSLDPALGDAMEREAWVDALVAYGLRLTELPLGGWLSGEALLSYDATHLEVLRPASAVDIALRRAALDSDPGWVPWLGKVVSLRYLDDRAYAALKPTAPQG